MTDGTNPATINDVVLERPLTDLEQAVVPQWLDQAWAILQVQVPGVAARVALAPTAPGALAEAAVRQVLGAMVERKVRNPDGLRSWTVDDVVSTVDAALSTGQLYATAAEVARLTLRVAAGGAYSLQLGR